jgi:hypothetical protein
MGLIAETYNQTPAPYLFIIQSELGENGITKCDPEPIQWKEGITKLSRDWEAGGVFASYVIDSLTFLGNGAKVLRELFRLHQINAEANLIIKIYNQQTLSYKQIPTTYQFKFGTYKIVKIGKFAIGVNISVSDSGTLSKFKEREDVSIDITRLETIGGMKLDDFENFNLISKLKIPAINSSFNAYFGDRGLYSTDPLYSLYALALGFNAIPAFVISSDFSEAHNVYSVSAGASNIHDLTPIFLNSTEDRDITLNFTIYINVDNGFGSRHEDALDIRYAVYSGITQISDQSWLKPDSNPFGRYAALRMKSGRIDVHLDAGQSLYFYISQTASTGIAHFIRPTLSNSNNEYATYINIRETIAIVSETIIDGMPIPCALHRMAQMILDNQYAFYSEFFGITDLKYTSSDYYSSEDSRRFGHILSGLNARGLTIFDADGKINIKPKELLKSISAMYCTGYGFETIGNVERLRVENRRYFFNDTVILDLSDRINEYDIIYEYLPNMAYIQIIAGNDSFIYRSTNGRQEYNTLSTRTTQLKASETLDLKSEIRKDQTALINCFNKPVLTYGGEDLDEDNSNFIIKTQREETEDCKWIVETTELVNIDNDSSPYRESSFNLYLSPFRCLYRNSELFTPALQVISSSKLRFQTTGKLSSLETTGKTTGEDYTVKESQDFNVNQFPDPYIQPIMAQVDSLFTNSDLTLLLETGEDGIPNRYKLIKLASNIYVWLFDDGINKKNAEDKASIKGILKA